MNSIPTIRDLMTVMEATLTENVGYRREIPRDLFNEANLLKCYGKVYLEIERLGLQDVKLDHDGQPFMVAQDQSSGDLTISNVRLMIRGQQCPLFRPLNSRHAWPLYAAMPDGEEIEVFTGSGSFTPEMQSLLTGGSDAIG